MNTTIAFRGYKISVGTHDRWAGCQKHTVSSSVLVTKDGKEFSFHRAVESVDGVVDGEVLFSVLNDLMRTDPNGPIRLPND